MRIGPAEVAQELTDSVKLPEQPELMKMKLTMMKRARGLLVLSVVRRRRCSSSLRRPLVPSPMERLLEAHDYDPIYNHVDMCVEVFLCRCASCHERNADTSSTPRAGTNTH